MKFAHVHTHKGETSSLPLDCAAYRLTSSLHALGCCTLLCCRQLCLLLFGPPGWGFLCSLGQFQSNELGLKVQLWLRNDWWLHMPLWLGFQQSCAQGYASPSALGTELSTARARHWAVKTSSEEVLRHENNPGCSLESCLLIIWQPRNSAWFDWLMARGLTCWHWGQVKDKAAKITLERRTWNCNSMHFSVTLWCISQIIIKLAKHNWISLNNGYKWQNAVNYRQAQLSTCLGTQWSKWLGTLSV